MLRVQTQRGNAMAKAETGKMHHKPRNADNHRELETQEGYFPRAFAGSVARWHLDFRLPTSRTVGE